MLTSTVNDLGGPDIRGLFDCAGTVGACAHALDHIDEWASEEHVANDLFSSSTYVRREPKGVVLIIAPWNYPVELTFHPLVYALAAGNCVVIKPSEVSASCPPVIRELVETFVHASPIAVDCRERPPTPTQRRTCLAGTWIAGRCA